MWFGYNCYIIFFSLVIPCHTIVAGYYGFMLDVRVSVHLSVSCVRQLCPSVHFFVSG